MKHSPFDMTILAHICAQCNDTAAWHSNVGTWHGVVDNIGDSGVGITLQMCNRILNKVTNR